MVQIYLIIQLAYLIKHNSYPSPVLVRKQVPVDPSQFQNVKAVPEVDFVEVLSKQVCDIVLH